MADGNIKINVELDGELKELLEQLKKYNENRPPAPYQPVPSYPYYPIWVDPSYYPYPPQWITKTTTGTSEESWPPPPSPDPTAFYNVAREG